MAIKRLVARRMLVAIRGLLHAMLLTMLALRSELVEPNREEALVYIAIKGPTTQRCVKL